jgi:hypothetical protein
MLPSDGHPSIFTLSAAGSLNRNHYNGGEILQRVLLNHRISLILYTIFIIYDKIRLRVSVVRTKAKNSAEIIAVRYQLKGCYPSHYTMVGRL